MLRSRGFLAGRYRRSKPGLPELSRWLREALRAIPPVMNKKRMHPGGMPETYVVRFWHLSGMRFLSAIITGDIARQTSLNHRLKSQKPLSRNIS
jgi:hypothetical protein